MMRSPVFRSFVFRLALALAALFALVSAVSVLSVYFGVFMHLRNAVDTELFGDLQEFSQSIAIYNYDVDALQSVFTEETKEEGPDNKFCRIVSDTNEILASSDMSLWPHSQLSGISIPGQKGGGPVLKTIRLAENRKARVISGQVGPGKFLQIGIVLDKDKEFLSEIRRVAAVILTGMLFSAHLLAGEWHDEQWLV
ncbi:MAG: hypothetical protein ABIH23_23470 [bacterium]